MNCVASIQVRLGSSRLPGKVMKEICGQPVIGHLLDRLERCRYLDDIGVATSELPENDLIYDYCLSRNMPCFRGSEEDVLSRLLGSLQSLNADIGVVVFGDCPLIDPVIVDEMISAFKEDSTLDFLGNDLKTTYPPGMDVEVFKTSTLKDSHQRATDPAIREHGTLFIRMNPSIYNLKNIEAPTGLNRPDILLGLDTVEDFELITAVLSFVSTSDNFSLKDIIEFLDRNPDIKNKNQQVHRRWKQYRSDE